MRRAAEWPRWGVRRSDAARRRGYVRLVRPLKLIALLAVAAVAGLAGATIGLSDTGVAEVPRAASVKVFFVKGERFTARSRAVRPGEPAAAAAVRALLAGPTRAERAAGIETTLPARTRLVAVAVGRGTATVELSRAPRPASAFDVSLRPARAAQIVYTLTALPAVERVLIRVNGADRAVFTGTRLALKGPLARHDLTRPIKLPAQPRLVPKGPAPADARGVQKRLGSLGYLPAKAVTGRWDARTSQAVLAFQAWEGLSRDAVVGPQTLAALERAARPKAARAGDGGRHVEVYRAKGVTLLVEHGKVVRALHSSSGAGRYATPAGSFSVFRKELNSWSVPYQVWLPHASYFNGGIAFHGYRDVPARPASHGCVRLPLPEAPFAYAFMAIGTPVAVF